MKKNKIIQKTLKILGVGIVIIPSAMPIISFGLTTTPEISATSQAQGSKSLSNREVIVTPENFSDYFSTHGVASYDSESSVITLTPDQTSVVGGVTLNTKVDLSQDFDLTGEVNLGSKDVGPAGVGFLMHPGDVDVLGETGNAMGIGGVKEGFGFKLDTYWNYESTDTYASDPIEMQGKDFGAIVENDENNIVHTIANSAQEISHPSNNTFKPIEFKYDGNSRTLTVTYEGKTWQKQIDSIDKMALGVVASTGAGSDLQQFKFNQFKYTVAQGRVNVNYLDEDGKEISNPSNLVGDIDEQWSSTPKDIDGYTFERVEGNTSGKFTANDQSIAFIYTKNPVSGGDVTAKYVDTAGNKISDDVVKSGNVGDSYTTEQKDINGYTFKEVQGNATGAFTDQAQTVTYVYTKNPVAGGDVTAKYVDTAGNKISDDVVKSGNVGDSYTTEQKDINGYTFKEVQGNATGTFTDQVQTVTYVYTKNKVIPKPDNYSGASQSGDNNGNTDDYNSGGENTLPQTGDDTITSYVGVLLGIILLMVTTCVSAIRFKKSK